MDVLYYVFSWGSPVGISLFFFFSGMGAGIFLWGISHLPTSNKKDKEEKTWSPTQSFLIDDSAQV